MDNKLPHLWHKAHHVQDTIGGGGGGVLVAQKQPLQDWGLAKSLINANPVAFLLHSCCILGRHPVPSSATVKPDMSH
jgi:hypothetical protein